MLIAPSSVCHQLSWKGRPNAFSPQNKACGLSGSPTLAKCLSDDRLYLLIISSPSAISILTAVGAVYQTFTLYSSIILYQRSGLNLPSNTTADAPFAHDPKISYAIPVTHPGSAVHQYTSSSFKSNTHLAVIYS